MAKRKSKKSVCARGFGNCRGFGKLKPFRMTEPGMATAASDSVDAIYDMVEDRGYGNQQMWNLYRTTPKGGRTLLTARSTDGAPSPRTWAEAREFARRNEAMLSRGGTGGLLVPTTPLGWWLSLAALGLVGYYWLKK